MPEKSRIRVTLGPLRRPSQRHPWCQEGHPWCQEGHPWCQEGHQGVRKVTHGARKVTHGVRKVTHGVRKVTHQCQECLPWWQEGLQWCLVWSGVVCPVQYSISAADMFGLVHSNFDYRQHQTTECFFSRPVQRPPFGMA